MKRFAVLSLALVAVAGCPAPQSGPAIVVTSTSPGTAATATPSAQPTAAATATATPAGTPAPLGPAPQGGSLADVQAAYTGTTPFANKYKVRMTTTQGDVEMTLFPDIAPAAAAKFKLQAENGVYDDTSFHRVIAGFVAQGGDPLSKGKPDGTPGIGTGTYGSPVPDAFQNGLKHLPGSLAFAHSAAANSSYTQFYICLTALPSLDDKYIVFGQVTGGFDVVQKLAKTEVNGVPTTTQRDRIVKVTISE